MPGNGIETEQSKAFYDMEENKNPQGAANEPKEEAKNLNFIEEII